jgi:hypothetical protein
MAKATYKKPKLVDLNGKKTARGQQCQSGSSNVSGHCTTGASAPIKHCRSGGAPGRNCSTGVTT